jgi:eukaryotic-like serine/threonine-protein kinase
MGEGELLSGRYRLVERLGSGGMSDVWRGHDEVLDRPVALKVLASRLMNDDALRRRVRIEARAAARISHPHVTSVYDFGESPGPDGEPIPFVVMELVDGLPMASHLAGGQALPWRMAVSACGQVAGALGAAHAHRVVHRDIKPGNVILTAAGVKVLDFGISALVGEPDVDERGELLGTPAYLAPERLAGGAVSPASDMYALGLLLYRSLTGHLPWQAETTTQMLKAHLHADPGPLPPVDGLPPEVAALCERCLAKRPADRPTSVQVARELAAVLGATRDPASARRAATVDTIPTRRSTTMDTMVTGTRRRTANRVPAAAARLLSAGHGAGGRALSVTGLIVTAGLIWAGAAWPTGAPGQSGRSSEDGTAARAQAAAVPVAQGIGPRPGSCTVEYKINSDRGTELTANLAVTNTGTEALRDWRLEFDLPGAQRLLSGTNAAWRQDDHAVTADAGGAVLAPAATTELTFTTSRRASDPLPVTYQLNGIACTPIVLGVPGGGHSTADAGNTHEDGDAGKGKGRKGRDGDD